MVGRQPLRSRARNTNRLQMIRFHAISRLDGDPLDGIHLLWSPPFPAGHSLDGFTIYRRAARGDKKLHCFDLGVAMLAEARSVGVISTPDGTVWADAEDLSDPLHTQWTYRVELTRRHSLVSITAVGAKAAFAETQDGAVIAGQGFVGPTVTLHGSEIATVWIVTDNPKDGLRICGDDPQRGDWAGDLAIVKNLQVPFAAANPAVSSTTDGRAMAASRALPEPLDGDFDEVSRYANAALARPAATPAWSVVSERPGDGGNDWDVSPYGLAIATTLLPPWRRALGFAHLDSDGLTPGRRYDYHLVGTIRRRDRDEVMHDLHTVPRGYRLPRHFRWGSALVWSEEPPVVRALVTTAGDPATIRKGFETDRLVVSLDNPSPRIVLDLVPGGTVDAKAFRHGAAVASVTEATSERTMLDFGTDADLVIIEGRVAIAGIVPLALAPALDPDEPVPVEQTIYDIEYAPTTPPPTPGTIAVTSLSDPARTAARGVHDTNRGFAITWEAPPAIDPAALPYVPSSQSAPPTEVASYVLERSWQGRPFAAADGDGTQVSGRNAPTATDVPAWGFDVLRAFPPVDAAPSSHSELVNAVEVFEPNELTWGDEITYRVSSVDATGRRSAPRTSAATPLRKHTRPPSPSTPPLEAPTSPGDVPPSGVEVRLLQVDDPDLTAEQTALTAGGDVVVVRWGWGPDQRALDPDVTEFRVYGHGCALTALDVRPAGTPSTGGAGWSVPVHFDRPVAADEFAGVPVVLGAAYRIAGHPAGIDVVLSLDASPVDPGRAPSPQPFTLNRTTSAQLDCDYWDERLTVVPRTPATGSDDVEGYQVILPATWVAVDAQTPRQRAGYGVTAADAEPYVRDRRAAVEPAPRPGNESTVAAAEVTARDYSRPTLVVADLTDIPALTLPRQAGDDVHGALRPADHLPPGSAAAPRMLLERVPASAVLPRLRVEPSAISLVGADGTVRPWTLSADDAQMLRDGYAAGRVPDRFLAHAAAMLDGLDTSADPIGIIDPSAAIEDTLPNRPSRWLYRLRAVDATSRPSAAGQVLAVVVHVPSAARAVMPTLQSVSVDNGTVTVLVDCRRSVGDVYVFLSADESLATATASLATIRNRNDLAPVDRLVVRDAAGRRLAAVPAAPDADGIAEVTASVPSGGFVVHVWAIAVTPDGVPSRLIGPLHADALAAGV